jgi:ribosomal protein L16 Arg81 hydroxylase
MVIKFGINPEFFEEHIQGKKPYLFKGAAIDHNINWQLINELISRHDHTSSNFKILKNGLILKYDYLEQYQEVFTTKYRSLKPKLYELMKGGASLALNKIENCPQTDRIRKQIANFSGRQTIVSGYAAFGHEPSFGNHWDTHDVFAVQLIGKKRWTIYEPTEDNPLYKNSSVGKEHQCKAASFMDIVLEAGDVFYLPRGWWHEVTASGSETFHLAIGTYPPYVTDYLNWLIEDISVKAVEFRMPLDKQYLADNTLGRVASHLYEATLNPENQRGFLQWFSSQQRLDSPYAIELFGNPNATPVPNDSLIGINANNCRLWHDNELIVNGIKLSLDETSQAVVNVVAKSGLIKLNDLVHQFPNSTPCEIRRFIIEMVEQDAFSIYLPNA